MELVVLCFSDSGEPRAFASFDACLYNVHLLSLETGYLLQSILELLELDGANAWIRSFDICENYVNEVCFEASLHQARYFFAHLLEFLAIKFLALPCKGIEDTL